VLAREDLVAKKGPCYARLTGRGYAHDGHFQMGDRAHDITAFPAAQQAVGDCLADADCALEAVDLFELYAPCSITEALVTEAIGLFAKGEGCRAARDGISGPGGARPVNTSGGCLARGHPPSLTGLYGLLECAEQVTGRAGARQVTGARRALHTCEGGNYNLALAHMLEGIGS
jgi:acetyl-CoA acetyltransferase